MTSKTGYIKNLIKGLAALSLLVSAFMATATPSSAEDLTSGQKSAIEEMIHEYILNHPEVIIESVNRMQARDKAAEAEKQKQMVVALSDDLFNDPNAPVDVTGDNPDVTIVEFFDYQCGYCKKVFPSLKNVMASDDKIRFIYKEFPILGPQSVVAAKAALASVKQGKYSAFHDAMMGSRGQLTDEKIFEAAASVGIDVDRLKKDMEAPEIQKHLDDNYALAQKLGVGGTPALVVGKEFIPGAISEEALRQLIDQVRNES